MAERRMFAKTIIDSDAFIDMPVTARLLYYDLGMRADDDGFVNAPKKIMRMVGASEDDMRILIARKFIIPFESGVVVIKHWRINNYLRSDRYKETTYKDEKKELTILENGAYRMSGIPGGIPQTEERYTQNSIGKDSIDKSILIDSKESICSTEVQQVVDAWNELGINPIRDVKPNTTRYSLLRARIKQYNLDDILTAISNIRESAFLMGQNKNGWTIKFDWFIKPNNFQKVLEGNYANTQKQSTGSAWLDRIDNAVNMVDDFYVVGQGE